MTEQDKQLLLKDICARLPYGVKVKTPYNDATLVGIVNRKGFRKDIEYIDIVTDKQTYPIRYIKPYLRPLSNMTEEERQEYLCTWNGQSLTLKSDDWLNAHYFDYHGLIAKGLALPAPEGMYDLNK